MKKISFLVLFLLFSSPLIYGQNKNWKLDGETTSLVQRVLPSVVSIYMIPQNKKGVVPDRRSIYGAGVIVDSRGLILTNLSLVKRPGHKIVVFLTTGKRYLARRIGQSPKYGIALLKIQATHLHALPLGDSSKLQVGALAFKFGNAFQTAKNYLPAVNMGTISGLDTVSRWGEKMIRIDAGINRGDFGGPLVDVYGNLVGILLPMWVHPTTNTYVSYAVPINAFKKIIPELKGYMGVLLTVSDKGNQGALVEAVDPTGPSAKAGLRTGDRIMGFGGQRIKNSKVLVELLKKYTAGDRVGILLTRNGRNLRIYVTLGEKIAD